VKKSGVLKVVITTCALSLIAAHLSPATAAPAAQIVTCVDLASGKERISKTGTCRTTEATAKWHLTPTDLALASGGTTKSLTICSNKESSPVAYQRIRTSCYRVMQTNLYTRSSILPAKPVITQVSSTSYESASLALASDPAANVDAPIAYYTITSSKGDVKKVNSWRELTFTVSGLRSATSYTFTITATSVDGTSPVSESSLPVTTPAYVAPVAAATTAPLAAPAFTLSAAAETKTVNTAIAGYTISSTGGTIASYAISPAAPAGLTFNTTTGLLSGTPTSTQSATAYTITATNATGSATQTFTFTVALAAPAFTLSASAETKTVNTAATGFTIASSTGGTIASFGISATPSGMSFSTTTGALSGTPNSVASATAFTVTATNASGSTTQIFTLTVTAAPSTVATLTTSSTIKGQTPVVLGTPSATLSSATGGSVTITAAKGADTSNSGSFITAFTKTSSSATLTKVVKYSSGANFTGFASDTAYNGTAAISTGDFFIVQVTAEDGTTILYYKITVTVSAAVYTVGQAGPGGGTIFYVAPTPFACGPTRSATCTYLEAAPSGWNGGAEPTRIWAQSTPFNYQFTSVSNATSPETATATAIGWGYRNTRAIILQGNSDTATSAAALADSHTVTVSEVTYDDWYLPSKDELNQMCKWQRGITGDNLTNLTTVCTGGTINTGAGAPSFLSQQYWSSSEADRGVAFRQNFGLGRQFDDDKKYTYYVRPVRSF